MGLEWMEGPSSFFWSWTPETCDPLLPGSPLIIVVLRVGRMLQRAGTVLWKKPWLVPVALLFCPTPGLCLRMSDFPQLWHADNSVFVVLNHAHLIYVASLGDSSGLWRPLGFFFKHRIYWPSLSFLTFKNMKNHILYFYLHLSDMALKCINIFSHAAGINMLK